LLLQPYNLLILDEPTNHLDMLSKEVLKQALLEYDGAMIVVSHDRDFLDGLTDRVLAFRNGAITEYTGDVDDYVNSLRNDRAPSEQPVQPKVTAPPKVEVVDQKELNRERKRLERRVQDLERQIGVQEKTIAECETTLSDPDLYKDPVLQHKTTQKYETAKQLVVSLMKEWEDIQEQLLSMSGA
jgi:ATP-binding cassette subfamily F protein 3